VQGTGCRERGERGKEKGSEAQRHRGTEAGKRLDDGDLLLDKNSRCRAQGVYALQGAEREVKGERRIKCQADLLFLLVFISCCSSEVVLLVRFYEPMPCYYSK
jgi:hypothetical protein